ncbi:GNAT family N-acetyltransferase [Nocardia terpenica]|uniref:Acetyltransferase n=1 Tax=Nocardia terpenica TaxID=455432 RepID=A0A164HYR9_9NOCA|nr:acetyltransferase [Nocardia terpenica]MBF6062224.1 GNAT family N-acetyltransferase [Nocardia terpenica]MBF6104312.1 GNAT family N-acetyltransferase [Nocardia terpenica]MBF6109832.1 GNAT family N-acetyltransferase [Nocardia terpenica]MBF6120138.1 GNAT family N-acetyltransferase [Nocardia terpenica]
MEDCVLTDGKVWLSRPTEADIDSIVAACQEPSIGAWTTVPVPYGRADAEYFLTEIVDPGWAGDSPTWALRPAEDGPVRGMIGFGPGRADPTAAEIGFWLSPALRGRGAMTRALLLACAYAFHPEGPALQRIEWRAFVGNHASAAVARRAGFHYEGTLRLGALHQGIRRDSWIAARLATDPPTPAGDWPPGI